MRGRSRFAFLQQSKTRSANPRTLCCIVYVNHNAHGVSPGACKEAEGRIEMCRNFTKSICLVGEPYSLGPARLMIYDFQNDFFLFLQANDAAPYLLGDAWFIFQWKAPPRGFQPGALFFFFFFVWVLFLQGYVQKKWRFGRFYSFFLSFYGYWCVTYWGEMIISCERCEVPFLTSACFNLNYDGAQAGDCENGGAHFPGSAWDVYIHAEIFQWQTGQGWCAKTSSFPPLYPLLRV